MTPNEIKLAIAACDITNQVPLISGLHGIGKSETVKQYANENDMHCEILIMSLLDTSDLCGLPRSVDVGGNHATIWSSPSWLNRIINAAWPTKLQFEDLEFSNPDFKSFVVDRLDTTAPISRSDLNEIYCAYTHTPNDGLHIHIQDLVSYKHSKRSILFVDEFNRSPSDVLNASLQLILDKRLNDHRLPIINGQQTLICAAINPSDGDYSTMDLDPALLDRFSYFTAEADLTTWLDWARKSNVAPVVRDFLSEHPNRLHFTAADGKSSATPRSWASLGRTIDNIDSIPEEIHFQLFKGLIGQELAGQFLAYYNNYFKVIKMDDIEAFITKQAKKTTDIQKIGEAVNKLIADQEIVQKQELAEQFYTKYADLQDAQDVLPLIAFLEGLDTEILASFLKSKRAEDAKKYMHVAKIDGILNGKNLFSKIVTKVKV